MNKNKTLSEQEVEEIFELVEASEWIKNLLERTENGDKLYE